MNDPRLRLGAGAVVLIVAGTLLLLDNFGVLAAYQPLAQIVVAALSAVGALALFATFARARTDWWRLIPAWTLVALAAVILLTAWGTVEPGLLAAVLFVGLALGFTHVYLLDRRERWWAVIPGGFMLVLALVLGLGSRIDRTETLAALLFGGLGLVFFVLYLLDRRRQWWALFPGSVLVVSALLAATTGQEGGRPWLRWWPVLLIVAGVLLGWRAWRRPKPEKLAVQDVTRTQALASKRKAAPAAPAAVKPAPVDSTGPAAKPALGDYTGPAPGATVEILPDTDD